MGTIFVIGVTVTSMVIFAIVIVLIILKLRHLKLAWVFNGPPALPLLGNALLFAGIDHNGKLITYETPKVDIYHIRRLYYLPYKAFLLTILWYE